jgi:hypothetical protein
MAEQQTHKIGMHALITTDQFVGECEARHQPSILHPEYGHERSRKEDSLDSCKGNQAFHKGGMLVRNPMHSPVSFPFDARDGIYGIKEIVTLNGILYVCVNQEGVCF